MFDSMYFVIVNVLMKILKGHGVHGGFLLHKGLYFAEFIAAFQSHSV